VRATAGFEFHKKIDREKLNAILDKIYLITPNTDEAKFLTGKSNADEAAKEMSSHCNVLLKGGHNKKSPGVDYLLMKNEIIAIHPSEILVHPKHGSGCVLSSAIAAELLKTNNLIFSCRKAKEYVEQFLNSNQFLLGKHYG
jgi:hydroxymethylpyrimidine/phosphomethylpyrimidine kinase